MSGVSCTPRFINTHCGEHLLAEREQHNLSRRLASPEAPEAARGSTSGAEKAKASHGRRPTAPSRALIRIVPEPSSFAPGEVDGRKNEPADVIGRRTGERLSPSVGFEREVTSVIEDETTRDLRWQDACPSSQSISAPPLIRSPTSPRVSTRVGTFPTA